jgi:hypothetical protein
MSYPGEPVTLGEMPRVFELSMEVDAELPKHGRGVISPEDMAATRAASCFGRLAVVGSQLVEEGLPSSHLRWLISLSHGMEFTAGKPWLGHAMLVVEHPQPLLIDSSHYMWSRPLSTTSWLASDERDLPVVDHEAIKYTHGGMFAKSLDDSTKISHDQLSLQSPHFVFTQHEFNEGIAFYQAVHPRLNTRTALRPVDFANFYANLGVKSPSL